MGSFSEARRYLRAIATCTFSALCSVVLLAPATAVAQDDVPEVARRLLEDAARHLDRDELDEAVRALRQARELAPDTARVYLDLGAALVRKGDNEASLEAFEAGLEREPEHRDLLYNAAVVSLRRGDSERALKHVDAALEHHGDGVDLLLVRSSALSRLERPEEALAALRRAEEEAPKSARIQFSLGNQLHALGRLDDAVASFRKAAELDPRQTRALYNLGAVLVQLGRYPEAREAYEKALAPLDAALADGQTIDPIHAVAYANLGAAYTQSQQWKEAVKAYSTAVRVDPSLAEAQLNLGFAYVQLDRGQKAQEAFEEAVRLDPDLSLAYIQLGEIHRARGRCERAVDWYQRGLPKLRADDRLEAMEGMARCYTELGRAEDAEQVFREVLAEAPSDPEVLKDFGSVLRRRGRLEEARAALGKSLELRPGDFDTLREALAVEEGLGDVAAQARLLATLVDAHGDREGLWSAVQALALVDLGAGRFDASLARWTALAKRADLPSAEKPRVESLRALVAWAAGSGERPPADRTSPFPGVRALAEAQAGDAAAALAASSRLPASPGAAELGGWLAWLAGRPADALRSWRDSGESSPAVDLAAAALSFEQGGSVRDAIERLDRALEACDGPSPRASVENASVEAASVLVVRPGPTPELCDYGRAALRRARLRHALELLRSGSSSGAGPARAVVDDPGATPEERAVALYVEGSSALGRGASRDAVSSLRRALESSLPAEFRGAAENDLAVALYALGQAVEAKAYLESARVSSLEAVLNLGILVHEREKNPRGALALYEEYVRRGGPRSGEAQGWIDRLRELYP